MWDRPPKPFRHWMRHTAMVPKGFLRYQVLRLLNEKPMSGSEIMQQIEKQSQGCWKPSPGSIYPLLAWLQEKGYIEGVPTEEAGMKRYTLTDRGKAFLEEHLKERGEIRSRLGFFVPPWFNFYPKGTREVREVIMKLLKAVWLLRGQMQEKYSEEIVSETKKALEEATKRIEEITQKLKKKKQP